MKKITFTLLLLNILFSNAQNINKIKESLIKENSLNIDKITIENGIPKGDIIYLKAKFKINKIGDFSDIIIHEDSKIFTEELNKIIRRIPNLNPNEYNTTEVYYDLHATIKLDSPKKRSKRIKNSKIENIKFDKLFVSLFLPYQTIEINKDEIFNSSQVETPPILNNCKSIDTNNRKEINRCLIKNLNKLLIGSLNTNISEKNGPERMVLIFVVSKDGKIININVRSDNQHIKEEAIRALTLLPVFKPAKINGKPVYSRIRMPINFQNKNN